MGNGRNLCYIRLRKILKKSIGDKMDKKKITNMEVKKKNRNDVFRYICRNGMVSNPDISHALKLSLPTATQITKELIGRGLVEEKGEMESTGGRKAKALAVSEKIGMAIGTSVLAGILGSLGYMANQQQNPAVLAVMKHSFTTVPGILWIVTAGVLYFYRLNRKAYNRIAQEIQERKESGNHV